MSSRTRNSFIPSLVASRGATALADDIGLARALRGYMSRGAGGLAPPEPTEPAAALSPVALDSEGTPRLLSARITSVFFRDCSGDAFFHPHATTYEGYASDGLWYEAGQLKPTHLPFEATWASEAQSVHRGGRSSCPPRVLVVATRREVCILDADTLDVWLRVVPAISGLTSQGTALGLPGVEVRRATFVEGLLFVATNQGLKTLDLRRDAVATYGASSFQAAGIVSRNTEGILDVAPLPATSELLASDCLDVDATPYAPTLSDAEGRDPAVIVAVGHPAGMTALTFRLPWSATSPATFQHPAHLNVSGAWASTPDGELTDLAGPATNWEALSVRAGDTVVTDAPSTHQVSALRQVVPGQSLVLLPALTLGASGSAYLISRPVPKVRVTSSAKLVVADGTSGIAHAGTKDWFWLDESLTPQELFPSVGVSLAWRGPSVRTAGSSLFVRDLLLDGDRILLAAGRSVFGLLLEELIQGRIAEGIYGPSDESVPSRFPILPDTCTEVLALEVDLETGNRVISCRTGPSAGVVLEVDVPTQRAFRVFDRVGVVLSLATYRRQSPWGV